MVVSTHAMQADLRRVVQAETSLLLWPYQCSYFFSSCLESPSITNLYSPSLLVMESPSITNLSVPVR